MDTSHIVAFITQLLSGGGQLSLICEHLVTAVVEDGMDANEATANIVGALARALSPRLESVPVAEVTRATELIEIAIDTLYDELESAAARTAQRN